MKKHSLGAFDKQLSARKAFDIRSRSEALKCYRRALGNFLALASLSAIPAFVQAEDRIPTGFKLERYVHLWEHNPFTLVTPSPRQSEHLVFEKLFLASWLREDGKEVIIVQNSDTNAVQRITIEPNQNNLSLIEIRLNPNPQLVEAMISDGKERGGVKFRCDVQSPVAVGPLAVTHDPAPLLNAQSKSFQATAPRNQALVHRLYPGLPRVHTEGLPDSTPGTPEASGKSALANSARNQ
jgi:hypothetical protein